jgi:CRISPR/Cas system CMR-associated protein Cmr5 small subunit
MTQEYKTAKSRELKDAFRCWYPFYHEETDKMIDRNGLIKSVMPCLQKAKVYFAPDYYFKDDETRILPIKHLKNGIQVYEDEENHIYENIKKIKEYNDSSIKDMQEQIKYYQSMIKRTRDANEAKIKALQDHLYALPIYHYFEEIQPHLIGDGE